MRPLIIGNWKMNGLLAESGPLARDLKNVLGASEGCEIVVCPPFTSLAQVSELLAGSNLTLGAQNVFPADKGAYTGEISMPMLRELGCTYVLVGHSERRQYLGETDELVARKVSAAARHGLTPVLCVGESREMREQRQSEEFVLRQVERGLQMLPREVGFVVAYEPIWAIGTGLAATTEDAGLMLAAIRAWVNRHRGIPACEVKLLYGGSVTPDNIAAFTAEREIDGALVGGASLSAQSFADIVAGAIRGFTCTDK